MLDLTSLKKSIGALNDALSVMEELGDDEQSALYRTSALASSRLLRFPMSFHGSLYSAGLQKTGAILRQTTTEGKKTCSEPRRGWGLYPTRDRGFPSMRPATSAAIPMMKAGRQRSASWFQLFLSPLVSS